jgi:hypothetical protein
MKTTRERTVLIAVLSVAGLGLLVDRVVIGSDVTGPAQSSAGVIDALDADAAVLPAPPQMPVVDKAPGVTFAMRLRRIAQASADTDPGQVRDAFTPGPGWSSTASAKGGATDNQRRQAAEKFKSSHRLEAVLMTGNNHCAVIDGRTVYLGQTLDGYRLVAVHERSVVFQGDGVRVELGISGVGPGS